MAAVGGVMPAAPPPPPPPVPVVRRISWIAVAAMDAVVCLWFASAWLFLASAAAGPIGSFACGWDCPVVRTAARFTVLSLLFFAIVWPLATLLLSYFVEPFYTNELRKGAAGLGPLSHAVRRAHRIAAVVFGFLGSLAFVLKLFAADDSPLDRIATGIVDVPILGVSAMGCFFSVPGMAVRVWRMRYRGNASVVPFSDDMELEAAN